MPITIIEMPDSLLETKHEVFVSHHNFHIFVVVNGGEQIITFQDSKLFDQWVKDNDALYTEFKTIKQDREHIPEEVTFARLSQLLPKLHKLIDAYGGEQNVALPMQLVIHKVEFMIESEHETDFPEPVPLPCVVASPTLE